MNLPTSKLLEMGFIHHPKEEHFGKPSPARFDYLYRKFQNNHQYVSVMFGYVIKLDADMTTHGDFLEAVFEAYWAKKDTHKPKQLMEAYDMQIKGWQPVHATIYRDVESLVEAVNKEYQLTPREKKKEKQK